MKIPATFRKQLVAIFALLFLAIVSQPAGAALYSNWSPANVGVLDPIDAGNGGKDIASIYYAQDAANNYFRMELYGAISAADHANLYGIYISNTPLASNQIPALASLVSMLALDYSVGTNNFLITAASFTEDVRYPDTDPIEHAVTVIGSGTVLEWRIPKTVWFGFASTPYFLGATITDGIVNDTTVATPVPNAVWLLGTGLIGLIALRRRSRGHA